MGFFPTHAAPAGSFQVQLSAEPEPGQTWTRTVSDALVCSRPCLFDYALAHGVNMERAQKPSWMTADRDEFPPHPSEVRPDGTRADFMYVYRADGSEQFHYAEQPLLEAGGDRPFDVPCATCGTPVRLVPTVYTGKGGNLPDDADFASR